LCLVTFLGSRLHAETRALDKEAVKRLQTSLAESGIDPSTPGMEQFLKGLHPTPEAIARFRDLIADLGDDDFYRREAAMKSLLQPPAHAPALFQEAIQAGDPEIRWRAREILKQGNQKTDQMLHASLQLIRNENMAELLPLVLKAIPFCTETYIREEAVRTLKALAAPKDAPLLQAALDQTDVETQRAALVTLEHLLGADADTALLRFLDGKDESLRYTAARALGNHGRREALPVLVDLLEADDMQIRANSSAALRLLTGENFSFVAYDTDANRTKARGQWVNWVADKGGVAKLNFPIPDAPILREHTLICNYSTKKVIELDANHKEVWSIDLQGAWGCQGLPNGHRLVTTYSPQRSIIEFDQAGKEIWRKDNLPGQPFSLERLDNANTLVTCSNNQILEYAPDGSIAWQQQLIGTPRDAQRLENGNTLVAMYTTQEIIEIDRQGQEVWKLENINRPVSAQRLPNGNTLVIEAGGAKLVELDQNGKEVWTPNIPLSIYDAQRLPNGNTLVVGSTGATEFDPQGKVVWQFNQPGMRGVHRF
jgi:outer membrane protein assembly factor BamB